MFAGKDGKLKGDTAGNPANVYSQVRMVNLRGTQQEIQLRIRGVSRYLPL